MSYKDVLWYCTISGHVRIEAKMFDQALIEEALTLTIIGLSTAFSLLFFLSISIWIVGKLFADKLSLIHI